MSSRSGYRVFVGGFTVSTQEEDLLDYFSQFGPITNVKIIRDKDTGLSKCYGFLNVASLHLYNTLLNTQHVLNDRILDCFPGFKKEGCPDLFDKYCNRKIFVGGLLSNTDDEKLKEYFSKFGSVRKAYVIRNPVNNDSKRFGFVIMVNEEDMARTLKKKCHYIDGARVTVKKFTKEDDTNDKLITEGENTKSSEASNIMLEVKEQTNKINYGASELLQSSIMNAEWDRGNQEIFSVPKVATVPPEPIMDIQSLNSQQQQFNLLLSINLASISMSLQKPLAQLLLESKHSLELNFNSALIAANNPLNFTAATFINNNFPTALQTTAIPQTTPTPTPTTPLRSGQSAQEKSGIRLALREHPSTFKTENLRFNVGNWSAPIITHKF